MGEPSFTVVCGGCGAEARNLSLVALITMPLLCPQCATTEAVER